MKKNTGIFMIIFTSILIISIYLFLCFFAYLYPLKHKNTILKYSKINGIDPVIVASIINVESSFNERAISNKGAKGLMQITDSTAKWICLQLKEEYTKEKMLTAEFNIKLGTYYFSYLLQKFNDIDTALACYNAGEGVVIKWLNLKECSSDGIKINNIPYKETESYVKKVNKNIKIYRKKF